VNIAAGMAVVCATGRGADGIDAALGGDLERRGHRRLQAVCDLPEDQAAAPPEVHRTWPLLGIRGRGWVQTNDSCRVNASTAVV
jgi:hypothetical protein